MATYISLVQFTDKGIRAAKDTTHRGGRLGRQGEVEGGQHQTDVLDTGSV
jgi:uncharacterized protein with GYD domain